MVMYLNEARVRSLLRGDPLLGAMEAALAAFSSGRVIQPVRNMITLRKVGATWASCRRWPRT